MFCFGFAGFGCGFGMVCFGLVLGCFVLFGLVCNSLVWFGLV